MTHRSGMRGLSIRQPWAHAVTHGGKRVENRTWAASYTGPVAIHAPATVDQPAVGYVAGLTGTDTEHLRRAAARGAFVAVAVLLGAHPAGRLPAGGCCCAPWGEPGMWHWQLARVRPLTEPIPAPGRLGLWRLDPDLRARLHTAAGPVAPAPR